MTTTQYSLEQTSNMNEQLLQLEERIKRLERADLYSDKAKTQEMVFVKLAFTPVTQSTTIGEEGNFDLCKTPDVYLVAEYQGKLYKLYAEPYDGDD